MVKEQGRVLLPITDAHGQEWTVELDIDMPALSERLSQHQNLRRVTLPGGLYVDLSIRKGKHDG